RRSWILDWLLLFILTGVLIKPMFKVKYVDAWGSVESTFAADARFLEEHWPHPRWQPLWYLGTRFDYIYPPALRYGTAGLSKLFPIVPIRAYHLYTAFFYCFGIAGIYLFVRLCSGSRGAGWLAAVATALVSPSFLLMEPFRIDSPFNMPQRLNVLVRWAEGPHMTALAWLTPSLAFSWCYVRRSKLLHLALAALCCAMVVSNNFYGATALFILFPALVWSLYITHLDRGMWLRAAAVPILTYGLTAFWLVPSYFRVTLENMRLVSRPGNDWSLWVALAAACVYLAATMKWARGQKQDAYLVFTASALLFIALNVLGEYYWNFRVIGEPGRMVPVLDLVVILFLAEGLRRLWGWGGRWSKALKAAAAVTTVAALATSILYIRNAWSFWTPDLDYKSRVEYRLQDWMATHMPDSRAATAGSIRFWYNAWNDLAQLGGVSEQGTLNQIGVAAHWQIVAGDNAEIGVLWMKILGVDAVIVNDKTSREHYHDFVFPEKYKGVLPVLHDDGEGNVIYGVPRRYPSLARVVEKARLPEFETGGAEPDLAALRAYAKVIEQGPEAPTTTRWEGTDELRISAPVDEGQTVLVQVSYDTPWRAFSGGQELPVRPGPLGFLLIDAPPGDHQIRLVFGLPFENFVGRIVSAGAAGFVLLCLVTAARGKRISAEVLA
ncbi:MAG: hypothetical protein ACRD7E_24685, partial [Bryobacteraceae bacterium]